MRTLRGDNTRISFFSFQDIITCLAGVMIFIALLLLLDLSTSALTPPVIGSAGMSQESARREIRRLRSQIELIEKEKSELARRSVELAEVDPASVRRDIARLEEEVQRTSVQVRRQDAGRQDKENRLAASRGRIQKLQDEIRLTAKAKAKLDGSPRRVVFTLPGQADGRDVVLIELSDTSVAMRALGEETGVRRLRERSGTTRQQWAQEQLKACPPQRFDALVLFKPSSFDQGEEWMVMLVRAGYRTGYEPLEEDRSAVDILDP